jgi:ABC-type antimicrobial peptide transport system permease subunit
VKRRATSIEDVVVPVVVCGLVAATVGAYVGFLFSLVYMIPFGIAAHHDRNATHDGRGRTGIACAIWLALVSIGSMPFAPASDSWHLGVASGVAGLLVAVFLAAYAAPRIDKVAPATAWPTSPYRAPAL